MIDPVLLDLVECPVTHQTLRMATATEVADLNSRIQSGLSRTVSGETVSESIDEALIRLDGKVAYPVREDIIVLLGPQGIELSA